MPALVAQADTGNPFEGLRELRAPWYVEILPDNRFLRFALFGAIAYGLRAIYVGNRKLLSGKGKPSNPASTTSSPLSVGPGATDSRPSAHAEITRAKAWYYHDGQREVGPFDDAALLQLLKVGLITPATSIRRTGGGNWIKCADVFGQS